MPPRRAVELRVGGQTYRVVASDDDQQVQHLAELVDRKFVEVVPHGVGRSMTAQQAMFLTAMALAAEVEEQRGRAARLEGERDRSLRLATRAKEVVARLLQRVDSALASARPGPAEARPADSRETRQPQSLEPRPSDARQSHPADQRPAFSTELRSAVATQPPMDVRQSHPRLTSPLDRLTDPPDARTEPLLIDLTGAGHPDDDEPPADETSPSGPPTTPSFSPRNDATVARTPRGGLRLVHRASSPPDDETR